MEREQSRDAMTEHNTQSNMRDQAPETKLELADRQMPKRSPSALSPPVQPAAAGRTSLFRK
jgi:hypothetical protein